MLPLDILRALSLALAMAAGPPPAATQTAAAPQAAPPVTQPEPPRAAPQLAQQTAPTVVAPPPVAPPVIAAPAPPVAQSQPSPAEVREELALWSRIRDTTSPEEIEAFLAAYPNGRLSALARQKLAELKSGAARPPQPQQARPQAPPEMTTAPPVQQARPLMPQLPALQQPQQAQPAPPPQPQNNPPFALNRSTISEAQERLYALNYYSGPINGQPSPQFRQALTEYQKRLQFPTTGVLDEATMNRMRAARPATRWSAMAFSARGANGMSWGSATRKLAETEALSNCRRNSRGQACKVIATPDNACAALAAYNAQSNYGDRRWGAYAAGRATRDAARDAALESCRGQAVTPHKCEITAMVCGDTGIQ